MEPLSALTVACAVVQFVDLGSKLIGTGLEVYKSTNGAHEDAIEVEALAAHAEQLSKRLTSSNRTRILNTSAQDEAKLRELASRSEKLANEIVTILSRIRGQPHHTWSAVRTAVRLKWNESKIESLQARLDAVKSEIWLQLLCMMSDEQSAMSGTIRKLDDRCQRLELRGQKVLTAVKAGNLQTASILKALSGPVSTNDVHEPAMSRRAVELLISASRTADEHQASEICKTLLKLFHDNSVDVAISGKEKGNYLAIFSAIAPACWRFVVPYAANIQQTLQQLETLACQTSVLDSLRFDDILQRENDITEAFGKTYTWNFGANASPLSSWLQTGSACPVRWAEINAAVDPGALSLWSESELKEKLTKIIDENESTHTFCFFIDGLNEFADNHYALVKDTIECFATRSNAKFCVSSRPYNVFNNSIGATSQEKLQLELLNHEDIDQFVQGKLEQNQLFRDLAKHDARAQDLALEIRKRADGVFLWVNLIVWELMDGLGENDDIATLQKRLDMLPEDLEKFLKHIIESVARVYRSYTAKCLLLAQRAREPLPIMAYAFLYEESEDPAALTRLPICPMSREDIRARRTVVATRISSWCKGLMEVKEMATANTWEPLRKSRVDFLHLSVKDFIDTPYMQHFLMEHAGADFQPEYKLVQLFTAMARVVDVRGLDDEMRAFRFMADEALYYAKAHAKIQTSSNGRLQFEIEKELEEIERSLERGRAS